MKRIGTTLCLAAVTTVVLAMVHVAFAHALDEMGLAERLFAGDLESALAALLVLAVLSIRVLLAFVVPGVVAAAATAWGLGFARARFRRLPRR